MTLSVESPRVHSGITLEIVNVQSVKVGDVLVDKRNKMSFLRLVCMDKRRKMSYLGTVLSIDTRTNSIGGEYTESITCENGKVSYNHKTNNLYKIIH